MIKNSGIAALFARTHHLKTFYIMSERMTGKAFWPSKLFFMSLYVPGKKKGINRTGRIGLLREKPAGRTSAGEPVFSKDVKRIL